METDKIIKDLNRKITAQKKGVEKLGHESLTEEERNFIEKHNPGRCVIIYGTLAPNRPNHSKMAHIRGEWIKGSVKGKLVKEGWGAQLGYFGFKHAGMDEQENIEAYMLFSDNLIDHWAYLDDFEGDGYQRILAKFELENGQTGVGNIYAINDGLK